MLYRDFWNMAALPPKFENNQTALSKMQRKYNTAYFNERR